MGRDAGDGAQTGAGSTRADQRGTAQPGFEHAAEDLGSIASEWEQLADRTFADPFLRPGWLAAWNSAFGGPDLEILTVRRFGKLEGVLPLRVTRRSAATATNWHSVHSGLIASDGGALRALAEALFDRMGTRAARLEMLEEGSPEYAAVVSAATDARFALVVRRQVSSPFITLDGEWEPYEQSLSGNLRNDIGRRRRRLAEQGDVQVEVYDASSCGNIDALLDEGLRVESLGWKGDEGTAINSQPATRDFYTAVAHWAAARGWLRLAFLRLDGVALAFHMDLDSAGSLFHLKGGYDPAFDRFSPGKLLHHEMIRDAFKRGLSTYEFLGGAEPYKLRWTNTCREYQVVEARAPSLRGRIEHVVRSTGHRVIDRVRRHDDAA